MSSDKTGDLQTKASSIVRRLTGMNSPPTYDEKELGFVNFHERSTTEGTWAFVQNYEFPSSSSKNITHALSTSIEFEPKDELEEDELVCFIQVVKNIDYRLRIGNKYLKEKKVYVCIEGGSLKQQSTG